MYRSLETVLVNAANKKDILKELLAFYSDDFLQHVLAHLRSLTIGERMFFGQLCRVAHLILVMPETNAVRERSFSTLRRVK